MAGLAGRCQSLRLVAAARHPDRYGLRRSLTAVAFRRPAHRPAASQAPCVPVRTPPFSVCPVWQPPPLRVERLQRGMDTGYHARRCFAAIRYGNGLPHGRFGKIRPSARATAIAVPYGHRRRLPQRHHGGRRVGTPKVASDRAASRFGFRRARRRIPLPQCGRRRLRQSACHDAGRGRWQPCRRSAVFARGYTPQPAHPPSASAAARPRQASINVNYRAS